jgi:hypothetical protein
VSATITLLCDAQVMVDDGRGLTTVCRTRRICKALDVATAREDARKQAGWSSRRHHGDVWKDFCPEHTRQIVEARINRGPARKGTT